MAKKTRRNKSNFYEALAAMPSLPLGTVASGVPKPSNVDWQDLWRRSRPVLGALAHDALLYTGRGLQIFRGANAKRLYVAAAITVVSFGAISAAWIGASTLHKYGRDLSSPGIIMNEKNTGTTIVDRQGVVLYQAYGAVDRHSIPLDEMPESLKKATLAAEDPGFYSHPGVSWRGTARAAYQDLAHSGKIQGGSTITQQLVKNTLLSDEKSYTRKYKEVLLATDLDSRYSKDQILQMYLNTIYYGQGAYGVEAASETYFHKPAKNLTLEESALLAALPQSPSQLDPNVNSAGAKARRDYVLDRMRGLGYINTATATNAEASPLVAGTRDGIVKAPHFVFYVLDQLRQQYGEDAIEHGGITVHTTLDYAKQVQAEQIIKDQITHLASHHTTNGGLVSLDPHNGDIINMVGSVDYNQPGYGNVNVTLSQLQPGSSFKPIAYATAFTKGWNGATKVDDKPIAVPQGDGTVYAPKNYDLKFRGPVLLRRALANSINIPAVEVLQYATVHDTITMAHNLGIQSPSLDQENRYGLSLVLGGGEVRPIDMASVYGALANHGSTVTPRAITKVTNRFGDTITKPDKRISKKVLDPRIAYMLTNILSDTKARQEEFGQHNPLELSRPAAAKTGTTNDFRDNWTVGYTPDLATAVWVGNNDHSPMSNVDGITGAAPIWHDYMEMATAGTPVHNFVAPAGVVTAKVCQADGGLVSDSDPSGVNEVFLAEAKPTKPCGGNGGIPNGFTRPVLPTAPQQPAAPTPPETTAPQQVEVAPQPPAPAPGSGSGAPGPGTGNGGGGGNGGPPPSPTPGGKPTP